jgi:DNA-binding MarR family transcriptional regulator
MNVKARAPRPREAESDTSRSALPGGYGLRIRDTHQAFRKALQVRLAPFGINVSQWFYLRALFEQDGITQVELSERVGFDRATITSVLASMEQQGLVERTRNSSDRRKINVTLTPLARGLRARLLRAAADVNQVAAAGIAPEEVARALEVIDRMRMNLDEERSE